MDDGDVEVTALTAASSTPEAFHADAVSPPDDVEVAAPQARRAVLGSRRTSALRLVRASSVSALLLLFIAAILFVPSSNRDALVRLVIPPNPSLTTLPVGGADQFLWEHSVPWGRLLIDGAPGPAVSAAPGGGGFRLAHGRHTLEYTAAYFPTLRCAVSVPVAPQDTCPLDRTWDGSFATSAAPLTRVLDLQATPDRLSPPFVQALLAATQARLSTLANAQPPGELAPGDHYRDAQATLRQITSSSAARTLAPQFDLASSLDYSMGAACVTVCARTGLGEDYTAQGWALLAPVDLRWRYFTADGGVALDAGPSGPVGAQRSMLIPILATWRQDTWQVDASLYGAQSDAVVCMTGAHYREVLELTPGQTTIDDDQTFAWPYAASTPQQGCLYAGSLRDRFSGQPIGPVALLLYRAGSLLAVNAIAHGVFPSLPMASDHERALANAVTPASLQ
jgi:hypothetical protein